MKEPNLKITDHVSFVMPAFNSAPTVRESVESIVNGNFEEGDEIIIVNDGSTDKTAEILSDIKNKHPSVTIIDHDVNRGCPAARNTGYARAKNKIIFNLYSDDVLVSGSVRKLKEYMISENAHMAGFAEYHYFKEEKNGKKKITHKWLCRAGILTFADLMAGDINPGPGGNFMFAKSIWDEVGGVWEYGKGMHEAWGFTLKTIANGAKFVVMPDSFYYHRYGYNSLFIREAKKENEVSLMATKMITSFLDLLDPKDSAYIKSEEGAKSWYSSLDRAPIKVKGEPLGKTGKIVVALDARIKTWTLRKLKFVYPLFRVAKKIISRIKSYISFIRDFQTIKKTSRFKVLWKDHRAFLKDSEKKFSFDRHYVYHPAWAARIVKKINPKFHTDISSTVHFCSILSAFVPVKFYDYRTTDIKLDNLYCGEADLLRLPFESESVESLSCMHTVEHIGLGRYGDPIDENGDLKAIKELIRVLAKGGSLLFVTPIGKPKIVWNAHRIYSFDQIKDYFKELKLEEFSLIPENSADGGIIKNPSKDLLDRQNYSCGCFWFKKP